MNTYLEWNDETYLKEKSKETLVLVTGAKIGIFRGGGGVGGPGGDTQKDNNFKTLFNKYSKQSTLSNNEIVELKNNMSKKVWLTRSSPWVIYRLKKSNHGPL